MDSIEKDRIRAHGITTILVVEDDRAIRLLFTAVLQNAGYDVIACEDGAHGLEAACTHRDRIQALITDSRMPVLGGLELVARIRAMSPEIPAIIVSGNMEDAPEALAALPATVFLCKPISPSTLTQELRRLLDARM